MVSKGGRTDTPLRTFAGDRDGMAVVIGAGGRTVIGSGESAISYYNAIGTPTTEITSITSDTRIELITKCQNINERRAVYLDNDVHFYPNNDGYGSIGTPSNRWDRGYFKGLQVYNPGSSWITGKTTTQCIVGAHSDSRSAYQTTIRINDKENNVWNLGSIDYQVGFYGFFKNRTANGNDWKFEWDLRSGNITCNKTITAVAHTTSSSIRYKENIEDLSEERARKLLELRAVTFDYKDKTYGTDCIGFIAEEVDEIEKYPVFRNEDQIEGLDYSKFVPSLVKLVQMQQNEIEELKKSISELKTIITNHEINLL